MENYDMGKDIGNLQLRVERLESAVQNLIEVIKQKSGSKPANE